VKRHSDSVVLPSMPVRDARIRIGLDGSTAPASSRRVKRASAKSFVPNRPRSDSTHSPAADSCTKWSAASGTSVSAWACIAEASRGMPLSSARAATSMRGNVMISRCL
jgi:hypothetical protein